MSQNNEEILANILNICESDPDAGLQLIESIIRESPDAESNPFGRFAKAIAYGSKGIFQLVRNKSEIDFTSFTENELRRDLGITNECLTYLEKALQEIREMEKIHPGALKMFETEEDRMGELKVDGIATVLERCRPGRVQEILGETKLSYFGPERVKRREDCDITKNEFDIFRDIFFSCDQIAKSALVSLDGTDSQNRRYVAVALYKEPEIFNKQGEQSPIAGFVCLYDDGASTSGPLPPSLSV